MIGCLYRDISEMVHVDNLKVKMPYYNLHEIFHTIADTLIQISDTKLYISSITANGCLQLSRQ